jgi:hypothetical protein
VGPARHQDFTFNDCTATWGTNGNYYNKHAFHFEAGANGHLRVVIENNQFGPSPNADRFCEAWNLRDARIRWNRFVECRDGGHYMDVAGTFKLIGNHYLRMSRMIFGEMQNECRGADIEIAYNVADGVVRWWNDTFGGSWVGWGAAKLEVHHNYWNGFPLTPNGPMDPGIAPRLGIINEVAGDNVLVHDNVAGGPVPWFNFMASAARGTARAFDNTLYGTITEGAMLEPEFKVGGGMGNVTDGGNNRKLSSTLMPPPDAYLAAIGHRIGPARHDTADGDEARVFVAAHHRRQRRRGGHRFGLWSSPWYGRGEDQLPRHRRPRIV